MNRSNEILAYLSLGYKFTNVVRPVLWTLLGICIVMVSFNQHILPYMVKKRKHMFYSEFKKKPHLYSLLRMNKVWYRNNETLFHLRLFEPEKKQAKGLEFYFFSKDWNLEQIIEAEEATLEPPFWRLKNGVVTTFKSGTPHVAAFLENTLMLDKKIGDIKTIENLTFALKSRDLKKFIKENKESGISMARYEVDYYNRVGHTFGGLVMALFALLFIQIGERKKGVGANIAGVFLLTFIFWLISSFFLNLGRHEFVNPFWAVWSPLALSTVFLLVLFNHRTKGRLWLEICSFFKALVMTRKRTFPEV